jgi:hypothetical protein
MGRTYGVTAVLSIRPSPAEAFSPLHENAAHGPAAVKVIGATFDEIWDSVKGDYGPEEWEAARLRIATIMLSLVNDGGVDAERLKVATLAAIRGR